MTVSRRHILYVILSQGVWSLGAELNDDPNIPRQAYAPIFPSENSVTHVSKENTVYASTTYYYDAQPFHILFRNQGVSPGGATIGQMTTPTGSEYINEGKWKAKGATMC